MPMVTPHSVQPRRIPGWVFVTAGVVAGVLLLFILLPMVHPVCVKRRDGCYFSWVAGCDIYGAPPPAAEGFSRYEYHMYTGDGLTWGFRAGRYVYYVNWTLPRNPTGPRRGVRLPFQR